MSLINKLVLISVCVGIIWARPEGPKNDNQEDQADYWNRNARETIAQRVATLTKKRNSNTAILHVMKVPETAKNVIIFMGDGMSVPTLAASRVYMGGENSELSFDKFPHTAISKTYCVDYQVADSSCAASAFLCGIKANLGTVGVTAAVPYEDCQAMTNVSNHVNSVAYWSQMKNKNTGFVTTARVTDASPAGVYAHTAKTDWESDTDISDDDQDPTVCEDTAKQLVRGEVGKKLKVIFGGGRNAFLPKTVTDEEGGKGKRSDGVNLIEEWQNQKLDDKQSYKYLWNRKELINLDVDKTDYVLGLFENDHCKYNLDRDPELDPSLEEMTETAIKILSKSPDGYFLFVEGARIDTAHHEARAHKALDETIELSKAVARAVELTSEDDTLIVVTSDHAHTLSFGGYPARGNDIFGIAEPDWPADDSLLFLTLSYANGPGYRAEEDGHRHDPSQDDFADKNYQYPGLYPLSDETHGGDDVIVFAKGPWSHLFAGVMEENVIAHIMKYASCVGEAEEITACTDRSNGVERITPHFVVFTVIFGVIYNFYR